MQSPKVSVILPNYNHARFLRQRIDSILEQTFQDFELIILDDCSSDNSVEVIESYLPNKRISHVLYNAKNSGSTFLQWQKGFSLAKGEYLWIAESDDYSDIAFLEKLVPLLDKDKYSPIAFCYSHLVDEKGDILDIDWDHATQRPNSKFTFSGKHFLRARMLFDNSIYNAGMALFRRSVLDNVGTEYTKYIFCGDWYFWNKICMQGNVIRFSEHLNYFRQHTNKITPKADSEGLKFVEGKYVFADVMNNLNFTSIERKSATGKFLKRILGFKLFKDKATAKAIYKDSKNYLCGSILDILIYELDKLFNFSGLNIAKNKRR